MYISNVKIKNFRGFKDFNAELSKLTIIVGENDSDKSNFLSAIARRDGGRDENASTLFYCVWVGGSPTGGDCVVFHHPHGDFIALSGLAR